MPAAAAKPKKSASPRRAPARAPAPVLAAVPGVAVDADRDELIGEIAAPAGDDFDDILGELTTPAKVDPFDDFDDILGELAAPAKADPFDDLDDILGELTGPARNDPADDLDDLLGELPPDEIDGDYDDVLGELAAPAALADDAAEAADIPPEAAPKNQKRRALGAKLQPLLRKCVPDLGGTRTVSRKRLVLLNGLVAVLGVAVVAEGAALAMRPAAAHAPAQVAQPERIAVTVVPVDYAKVDLGRYVDKVRALSEGGRDMLRHPRIKAAIVALDNGEALYQDMAEAAAHSPAAERIDIRDDHVTLKTCDGDLCGDKSYTLVYDIPRDEATVCVTKKYADGSLLSYSYGAAGYSEQPHC